MLRDFGERGLLEQFPAVVVAKAKAWTTDRPLSDAEREQYRDDQRRAVLTVMATYNPDAMVVIGADFGHTDPQYVVPYGGAMTVDGPAQRITAQY
jgi:muramoyltetrapeptide carboxypeptidase LdcA involved in peptidoglycan recycling